MTINKNNTLRVRDLIAALTCDRVDPDAPVVTATSDLHGWLQNLAGVKIHTRSGAVVIDVSERDGTASDEEINTRDLVDLVWPRRGCSG